MKPAAHQQMLDLNVSSLTALLAHFAPPMVGDVDDVARQGFEACMRGEVICVPGAINRAATIASRSTPKWLVRRIGGAIGRKAL
jgi:hypothetical protein